MDVPSPAPVPGFVALSAFLRGIERRAFVLAQAQCGDSDCAQAAVAAALQQFCSTARTQPLSSWPASFWSVLVARPELLAHAPSDGPLACLSPGPRAVVLLGLVAGLDTAHVAQVLGVSVHVARIAVDRALAQAEASGVTERDLLDLHENLQQQTRALDADQARTLNLARERALQTTPSGITVAGKKFDLRTLAWLLLALLLLALLATLIWPLSSSRPLANVTALPAETSLAPPPYDAAALVMHADYAHLAAPDGHQADREIAHDLALLSWVAAGAPSEDTVSTAIPLQETIAPESAQSVTETLP